MRVRLQEEELSFEELRREFEIPVAVLEDDLRHLERSLRRGPGRFAITPARCSGCGFEFRTRHLHRPSRCPRCRSTRAYPPRFRVEGDRGPDGS